MAPNTPKRPVRRFWVRVYCAANDLEGTVEVISTGRQAAREMVLRTFFRGDGWKVVRIEEITKDYERFRGAA